MKPFTFDNITSLVEVNNWFKKYKKELEKLKKTYDYTKEIINYDFGIHKRDFLSPGFEFNISWLNFVPDEVFNNFLKDFKYYLMYNYKWIEDVYSIKEWLVIVPYNKEIITEWKRYRGNVNYELENLDKYKDAVITQIIKLEEKDDRLKISVDYQHSEMLFDNDIEKTVACLDDAKEVSKECVRIVKDLDSIGKEIEQTRSTFKQYNFIENP